MNVLHHTPPSDCVLYGVSKSRGGLTVVLSSRKARAVEYGEPVIETGLHYLSQVPGHVPVRWATSEGLRETLPLEVPENGQESTIQVESDDPEPSLFE